MEHFFDHFSQFRNHLNVKAHEKPRKKKRWLLSRQYLQPLESSEEASSDDKKEPKCKEKTRLKCAYKAAIYGMKEGMLTGIFLGGCWGMFQKFNGGGSLGFGGGRKSGEGKESKSKKEPVIQSYLFMSDTKNFRRSINYTEPPPSHLYVRERNDSLPLKPAMTHRERVEVYEKSVQSALDYSKHGVSKSEQYKNNRGNVRRSEKGSPEPDYGVPYYDPNRYLFRRRGEKVETVGYAFIQTDKMSSSVDSVRSDGSGSPRQTGSVGEKKTSVSSQREENPGGEQQAAEPATSSRAQSVQSARPESKTKSLDSKEAAHSSVGKTESVLNQVATEISIKSEKKSQDSKKNSSVLISNEQLDQEKSWTESSRNILENVLEETRQSSESVKTKVFSQSAQGERRGTESFQSERSVRTSTESARPVPSDKRSTDSSHMMHIESRTGGGSELTTQKSNTDEKRHYSKHSGIISKKSSARLASSANLKKSFSKAFSDHRRTESSHKHISNPQSENVFLAPGSKDSILVDIDLVSNGYVSDMEIRSTAESVHTAHTGSSGSSAKHKSSTSKESSHRSPEHMVSYVKSHSHTPESPLSERESQRLPEYARSRSGGTSVYERSQSGHSRRRESGMAVDETSTRESFVYNKSYGSGVNQVQESGSTRTFSKTDPEERGSGGQRFMRRTMTSDVAVEDAHAAPSSSHVSRHSSVRPEVGKRASEAHSSPAGAQYSSVEIMPRMFPVEESPQREEAPVYRAAGPPPKTAEPEPKEKKPSRGFSIISSINENVILLSACNCAIVLGIICSVVSTTRASLAV